MGSSWFELGEAWSLNQSHDRNVHSWWAQAKSPCSEPQQRANLHLQHLPRRKPACVTSQGEMDEEPKHVLSHLTGLLFFSEIDLPQPATR